MNVCYKLILYIIINYDHCMWIGGNRAIYSEYDTFETTMELDCHGHGTHLPCLDFGIAKIVNYYSVCVLDCNNRVPWSINIDGLNFTATNIINKFPSHLTIISMSSSGMFCQAMLLIWNSNYCSCWIWWRWYLLLYPI